MALVRQSARSLRAKALMLRFSYNSRDDLAAEMSMLRSKLTGAARSMRRSRSSIASG